jgi:hypothetical protein
MPWQKCKLSLALWLRRLAWLIEGKPDRRGPIQRAQDAAANPQTRRRVVLAAWAAGVVVGEFVLPATSPLGELLQTFMRGAGYEQQRPGSIGPYPSAPGRDGGPGGGPPDGRLLEPAPAGPGPGP